MATLIAAFDNQQVLARTVEALGAEWRCVPDAVVRAWGEEGRVDLAALHPDHGVVLVGLVEEGDEASPDSAVEAFRTMLRDEGFDARFPGHLPVAALTAPPAQRARLAELVRAALGEAQHPAVPPGWVDWLADRLAPAAEAAPPAEMPTPRLVAPRRDEVPARPGDATLAAFQREAPVRSTAARDSWAGWVRQLGFALAVVAMLLTAMAIFSRAASLF